MGKVLKLLLLGVALITAAPSFAAEEFQEYEPLTTPLPTPSDKVEVIEFFWYGCPHCYHFEPFISKWSKNLPANAVFTRIPTAFREEWKPHARAYYAAELLDLLDKFHEPLFEAIHKDKRKIYTEAAILDFVKELGLDANAFQHAMHSFAVETKVRRSDQLVKASGITGVPSIVVAGKYRTSASLTGGHTRLIEVINELVEEESQQ